MIALRGLKVFAIAVAGLLAGCQFVGAGGGDAGEVQVKIFGETAEGRPVHAYTLTNKGGMTMKLIDYGAIMVSLEVLDRDGVPGDIILGHDTVAGYETNSPYFGAIVGRYGNRIAKGKFTLDGQDYTLATNDGPNHLHGGDRGFDKVVWTGEPFANARELGVRFTYTSPDGEEGYPGELTATVEYALTRNVGEISFRYEATTDKPTVLNLTQHNYYNLAGAGAGDILGHELVIVANGYTPGDETLIPIGEIASVEGTPLDFRSATEVGARIGQVEGGYDHNFVIDRAGEGLQLAAQVYEATTGRKMDILTSEPGIQFYSGNFLDGTVTGKGGKVYGKHFGLCLETQHYPDSPNQPNFPSAVLRPGETYRHHTVHRFTTDAQF